MPCRPLPTPVEPEPAVIPWPFEISNITVAHAPLLKVYYWESLGIDSLNNKLKAGDKFLDHEFEMPTCQINSRYLRVVFWMQCNEHFHLSSRRIRNCECVPQETRVGFNQFRQLYQCPHRHLVKITQEIIKSEGNSEVVALSVAFYFYLFGKHRLSFEMICNNDHMSDRIMHWHFMLDIVGFDPEKTVLSKNLLPCPISEYRRFIQPIWIQNITMMHLEFEFDSHARGLKILNPKLTVPRQSVWPLMVEYRPNDYMNELEIVQSFCSAKSKLKITAIGCTEESTKKHTVPINDNECNDFLYVIYPNRLEFNVEMGEERSLMVAIHNYSQQCVEFRWQNYVISGLFSVSYEPEIFRLKSHSSKLVVVHLRAFQSAIHFQRVPIILEVHRPFDKATKTAKALIDEVESLDDPKWAQESYLEHVLLELDLKVNFAKQKPVELHWEPPEIIPMTARLGLQNVQMTAATTSTRTTTIFEQLFWEHLSHSNFMRENKNPNISETLTYKEVLNLYMNPPKTTAPMDIDKNSILKFLSLFIAEAVRDISKNWIFVPVDAYLRSI